MRVRSNNIDLQAILDEDVPILNRLGVKMAQYSVANSDTIINFTLELAEVNRLNEDETLLHSLLDFLPTEKSQPKK